ncbi:MAG: WYL domain-containing protein [Paludibacteraceae bacterium]|nr:WYL domain-containing protein [Paludibacteraceae bacterium]
MAQDTNHRKNNKYQRSRCRALDKCLRNPYKRYYIENLIEACSKALTAEYGEPQLPITVSRRTVIDDLNYMESEAGFSADIEHIKDGKRTYYRYADPNFSINNIPLTDDEMQKLQETILVLDRFRSQLPWVTELLTELQTKFHIDGHTEQIIGFESNEYVEGLNYLEPLFQYITNEQAINLVYQPFCKQPIHWTLHPYYIKQYNNRWFLFALNNDTQQITNVPLDRIVAIEQAKTKYIPNQDIDFSEYFEDVIGVTIPDAPVETITLRFAPQRFPYELSKAIHPSRIVKDKENGIVQIKVIPNKELISQLLWFGNDVEVLEPASVRQEIQRKIEKMHNLYHQCK